MQLVKVSVLKKSRSKIVIYSHMHKALHSFMFAMAGQTAESNGLNFSEKIKLIPGDEIS